MDRKYAPVEGMRHDNKYNEYRLSFFSSTPDAHRLSIYFFLCLKKTLRSCPLIHMGQSTVTWYETDHVSKDHLPGALRGSLVTEHTLLAKQVRRYILEYISSVWPINSPRPQSMSILQYYRYIQAPLGS
jgi:hypothetical protein